MPSVFKLGGSKPVDTMDEAMDRLLKTQHHLLNSSRYQLKKGCPSKFVEVSLGPATSLNPAIRIASGKHAVYVSPEDWLELLHSEDCVMNFFVESVVANWPAHLGSCEQQATWVADYLIRTPILLNTHWMISPIEHMVLMTAKECAEDWFPPRCLIHFNFARVTDGERFFRLCTICVRDNRFATPNVGNYITAYKIYKNPREALQILQLQNIEFHYFNRMAEHNLPLAYMPDYMFQALLWSPVITRAHLPDDSDDGGGSGAEDDGVANINDVELRPEQFAEYGENEYDDEDAAPEDFWNQARWNSAIAAFMEHNAIPRRPPSPPPSPWLLSSFGRRCAATVAPRKARTEPSSWISRDRQCRRTSSSSSDEDAPPPRRQDLGYPALARVAGPLPPPRMRMRHRRRFRHLAKGPDWVLPRPPAPRKRADHHPRHHRRHQTTKHEVFYNIYVFFIYLFIHVYNKSVSKNIYI